MKRDGVLLSRRTVLRGAGVALGLPLLEAMLPFRAPAAGRSVQPPLRLAIFSVTGGTVLESWQPAKPGPLPARLPSILRPLEFARDDLLVISGLSQSGRSDGVNAHEHCACKHLTGAEAVKREGGRLYASVSVDQAVARAAGGQTFLPSLEIGRNSNEYCFRAPDVVAPFEPDPRLVFERMFRGRKPVAPNWVRREAAGGTDVGPAGKADSADQSVLDAVLDQVKDLRAKVGRADRRKLDGFCESVRSVERRLAFVESRRQQELLDLESPGPSKVEVPAKLPRDGNAFWTLMRLMDHDPEPHAEYIRLLSDLMILALQTDTTRVVTVAAGSDDAMFPGVVTVGGERHCHTIEHQGNAGRPEDADPIAREACRQIHAWYTGLFAEAVRKMKAIDEGGGSLLDNTVLVYTSYMSNGGHGMEDYPVVLVGKAQGTIKPGRHLLFEKKAPVANLHREILDRFGVKGEVFGDGQTSRFAGSYNGRLPGLV